MNQDKTDLQIMVSFRLLPKEIRNVNRAAKSRNMTRSQFIRYALLMSMEKMKENRKD